MPSRRDKDARPPKVRPLPLLDTWRRGTWKRYAELAADVLGGDIFTAVDKRTQCITAYLLRFGKREDGACCELAMFVYHNAIRYQAAENDIFELQHVGTIADRKGAL